MTSLIILSLLGFVILFLGAYHKRSWISPIAVIGVTAAFVMNAADWDFQYEWFGMMRSDNFSIAFNGLMVFTTLLILLLGSWHFRNEGTIVADIYALMLFSLVGGILMTSFSNLVLLFIGIEILSIALYVLAGSRRISLASNEASLKYFLMGAFSSGILLFGIALIFGAVNSFDLALISDYVSSNSSFPIFFHAGIMLIMIGLAFKIGAVPFHFWIPDVYQGSPTLISTFMATVVKTAGIAAFYRLFDTCFSGIDTTGWYKILWVICVLTILFGNISALLQNEAKRLLGWSAVSHAGYLLIPILALNELSALATFYYATAYSIATVTVFAVIMALGGTENEVPLERFKGLAKNNPLMTLGLLVGMFSLAGIPPMAGFFGKYYLFTNALSNGLVVVTVLAVLGSLIGIYYYFKPVIFTFNTEVSPAPRINNSFAFNFVIMLGIFLTLLLGLFPQIIANINL